MAPLCDPIPFCKGFDLICGDCTYIYVWLFHSEDQSAGLRIYNNRVGQLFGHDKTSAFVEVIMYI